MEVGCPNGWSCKSPVNIAVACDLSFSVVQYARSKFAIVERNDLWLRVAGVHLDIAKQLVYGYSIAQGSRVPIIRIATDESVNTPDNWCSDMGPGIGWLVSDWLPANAVPVTWEFVFPQTVIVEREGFVRDAEERALLVMPEVRLSPS